MWTVFLILLMLALPIMGFAMGVVAKVVVNLDYLVLFSLFGCLMFFGIDTSSIVFQPLLLIDNIHPVFVIIILIIPLLVWYGLQQITIFGIYIFRILGSGLSAFVFVILLESLLSDYYITLDLIWSLAIGIVYFIAIIGLRFKNNSIVYVQIEK